MDVLNKVGSGMQNCENGTACAGRCRSRRVRPDAGSAGTAGSADDDDAAQSWSLSSLQARILEGIAAGLSSGRLSRELYLSAKTIDYHVRVMSDKLQAGNRVALVSRAFVLDILKTDTWPPRVACDAVD